MRLMNYAVGLGCLLLALLSLSLPMAGCDVLGLGGSCSGAEGLRAEHDALLACAGWRDFVYDNIREIKYKNACKLASDHGGEVTGKAHCRSCRVEIATYRRTGSICLADPQSDITLAAILVHEAAHLEDDCKNGEDPAEAAEAAFRSDLATHFPGGCPTP
jgi:hypothetical protein